MKIIGIVPRLKIVILIIPFLCKSLFENHEILIHYYRFFIVITNSEAAAERTGLYRRLYPFEMAMMSQFNNNRIKLFIILYKLHLLLLVINNYYLLASPKMYKKVLQSYSYSNILFKSIEYTRKPDLNKTHWENISKSKFSICMINFNQGG